MKNPGFKAGVNPGLALELTQIDTKSDLTSSQMCQQSRQTLAIIGAGDGTRTHDVQLGKLTFYR